MNRPALLAASAAAALALGAGGYWLGSRSDDAPAQTVTTEGAAATGGERKPLYYRHPMGLPDTSPTPRKDSMGMDYVPVYADDAPSGPGFVIPSDKLQRGGVRTAEAEPRDLAVTVRAVGTVQVNERLQATVAPKFEGYVTRLYVATTGAPIRRGEPLLEVYSPELVSAQEEYRVARRNQAALGNASPEVQERMQRLVDASLTRLRNWDIDARELAAIQRGEVQKSLLIRSPVDGVVLEKMALLGQRFMAGEPLYQVAGLETVWLLANVFEQDLNALSPGRPARATFNAYPGRVFEGKVAFVYPALATATRTLAVRIELPNPQQLLKPGLYGAVEITGPTVNAAVAVPEAAVLDSGTRRLVFAAHPGGRFEAREVELGARAGGYVAIERGITAGETVVIDGNFLIDAESNLRAGSQAFGHSHGEQGSAPADPPQPVHEHGGQGAAPAEQPAATHDHSQPTSPSAPENHAEHTGR